MTHTPSRPEVGPGNAIWHAKLYVAAFAVLVGAVTFGICKVVTPVYAASATVSVTAASTPDGSAEDVALASNDLAAQEAQLVTTSGVLDLASSAAHVSPSMLTSHISAGTVASQNLVQVTAQSTDALEATTWASSVANALATYVRSRDVKAATTQRMLLDKQIAPLSAEIARLERDVDVATPSSTTSSSFIKLQSEESQLTQLLTTQSTLETSEAIAVASESPALSVLDSAAGAEVVSPRTLLYTLIAFVAGLVVAGEAAVLRSRQ